jgi:hypothetical protein
MVCYNDLDWDLLGLRFLISLRDGNGKNGLFALRKDTMWLSTLHDDCHST